MVAHVVRVLSRTCIIDTLYLASSYSRLTPDQTRRGHRSDVTQIPLLSAQNSPIIDEMESS